MPTRRTLLKTTATSLAFFGLHRLGLASTAAPLSGWRDFGPPMTDPAGIFNLPRGFSYTVLSRTGQRMDDGLLLPGDQDGMAAFPAANSRVMLICNHELNHHQHSIGPFGERFEYFDRIGTEKLFDAGRETPCLGGTTHQLYNPATRRIERCFLSLAGTQRNCAGGPTPWGSWLSCEETLARADADTYGRDHGWVFEVPAVADGAVDPEPLRGMGRFNHEACGVDQETGIVYMTEDRHEGLLYRYIPDQPGRLAAGGRLQALALADLDGADTRNWSEPGAPEISVGAPLACRWIDLDDIESPEDDLRQRGRQAGAAIFARGEGLWFGERDAWFACTNGGPDRLGQVWRYRVDLDQVELFVESSDARLMKNCDNLTVTPWGDLMVCEDRPDGASLIGVTPQGGLYEFATNAFSDAELCGVCFAPDGDTMFVNLQDDGLTLAIHGPFPI